MQIFKYILIGIALIGNGALPAAAQTLSDSPSAEAQHVRSERPTLKTNAMTIGVGATNMLDTYLSPRSIVALTYASSRTLVARRTPPRGSTSFNTRATLPTPTIVRAMAVRWREAIRFAIRSCASGT